MQLAERQAQLLLLSVLNTTFSCASSSPPTVSSTRYQHAAADKLSGVSWWANAPAAASPRKLLALEYISDGCQPMLLTFLFHWRLWSFHVLGHDHLWRQPLWWLLQPMLDKITPGYAEPFLPICKMYVSGAQMGLAQHPSVDKLSMTIIDLTATPSPNVQRGDVKCNTAASKCMHALPKAQQMLALSRSMFMTASMKLNEEKQMEYLSRLARPVRANPWSTPGRFRLEVARPDPLTDDA